MHAGTQFPPEPGRITELLRDGASTSDSMLNELLPLVYDELRKLARSRLRLERVGHTLNTTALVHEAYLKLADRSAIEWQSRAHFYAVASRMMRQVLVNYAEARRALKRGGSAPHVPLDEAKIAFVDDHAEEILALDDALDRLRRFNERGANIVVYRFFGGLTHDEIGEVMGISAVTVRRSWTTARSWLKHDMRDAGASPSRNSFLYQGKAR